MEPQQSRPPQPLPNFTVSAPSLLSEAEHVISKARIVQADLVYGVTPGNATFQNVILPLLEAENALLIQSRKLTFYRDVSPDPSIRESSSKANELFQAFQVETCLNEPLFKLIDAVCQAGVEGLDVEARRYLEKKRRDYAANGLHLPAGPARERFKDIKSRLAQLEKAYRKNLADSKSAALGVWFSREQLQGIPSTVLARLESGNGDEAGLFKVTMNNADVFPVLRHAQHEETRRRLYMAHENSVPGNVSILKEAIILRNEAAKLLGYPDHATFRIKDKMARTPERVITFLDELSKGLESGADNETKRIQQLKREHHAAGGEQCDDRVFVWDTTYYNNLDLKTKYSVDHQMVSEYFPLETVVHGILKIFEDLFGFYFVEVPVEEKRDKVWHEDVRVFCAWNAQDLGGEFVGWLYLDLHPRPGKVGHACSLNLIPGIAGQRTATASLCSFPKPDSANPSLLSHQEIVLLLHELGHCIHDLACKTKHGRLFGPDGTAGDFVEAPSQLLEYWFWTPSVLKAIGRHYSYLNQEHLRAWKLNRHASDQQPAEKMPDDMIERLIQSKNVNQAIYTLRQVTIGAFDMTIHFTSSLEDLVNMNLPALYNRTRRKICHLDDPSCLDDDEDWGHGFAIYPHLMDGYDAGFYAYLFSRVYAADIFYSLFQADPMNAAAGRRYRRIVLEKGGARDEIAMLTELLGREPRTQAFYQELNLA